MTTKAAARSCRLFLEIGDTLYHVKPLPVQDPHCGVLRLVRLRKADGSAYECSVRRDGWAECTCPDWTYRHIETGQPCKHVASLQAIGLLPAPLPPCDPAVWPDHVDAYRYELGPEVSRW